MADLISKIGVDIPSPKWYRKYSKLTSNCLIYREIIWKQQ